MAGAIGAWMNSGSDPLAMPEPVPTRPWARLECMRKGDTNEIRSCWDDVERRLVCTSATADGTGDGRTPGAEYTLPDFNAVWVGFQPYQGGGEDDELWVDEVAADPARIGCVI